MLDGLGARKVWGEAYAKSCSDIEKNHKLYVENNPKSFLLQQKMVVRILLFGVAFTLLRFVYVITQGGGGGRGGGYCDGNGEECVVSAAEVMNHSHRHASVKSHEEYILQLQTPNLELKKLWTTRDWRRKVDVFSALFQDLIKEGFLKPESKALCIGSEVGQEVLALKEIGVSDAVGIDLVPSPPLVIKGDMHSQPFEDNTFDFEFSNIFDQSFKFVSEIERTLKPGGVAVIHANDLNSIDSFVTRFKNCVLVRITNVDRLFSQSEIVLKKTVNTTAVNNEFGMLLETPSWEVQVHGQEHNCPVPHWKRDAINRAEPLIEEEPLKPWITLKKNAETIKYLPTMADIGNRRNYVYVDVGARSYGSSIGSWFMKRYPQQNKSFDVYAIEADPAFQGGYTKRKAIKLLPYAAWVRNESLTFEINRDAGSGPEVKGMGRIQPTNAASAAHKSVISVQAFDFAEWLKNTVSPHDFVVMKMDVEGTEFDLLPRMFQTGAICLIDELFLECHYNRWQRCCPERTPKYKRTYRQCLDLFNLLRSNGVLVHQWW